MKQKLVYKQDIDKLRRDIKSMLMNKYFNLFMDSYVYTGPDEEQADYLMKQFFATGTCASFKIPHLSDVGLAPYAVQRYNMYDFPEEVMLINKRNLPFIPAGSKVVKKDVVLGWIQANHKPIKEVVEFYINRITEVEMVINTNLQLHKVPWAIGVSPSDYPKAEDIVNRILNNEVAVFMSFDELNNVKALTSNSTYILDKLYSYKTSLEYELHTYLGLDNPGISGNAHEQQLLLDEVNSNNQLINANRDNYLKNIRDFLENIKEVLGVEWTVEPAQKPVQSIHEESTEEREVEEDV